jgi:hypothetical protein
VETAFNNIEELLETKDPNQEATQIEIEDAAAQWEDTRETFGIVIQEQEKLQDDEYIFESLIANEDKRDAMRKRYNTILFGFNKKFKMKQEGPTQKSSSPKSHSTMPKLETLKMEFSGEPLEYFRFRDLFKLNIDSRSDLNDIAKLSHLLNYLKGPAKKLVKGYQVIAENYPVILDLLEEEYGKVTHLRDNLLDKLTDLMGKKQFSSEAAYKEFYVEAMGHSRALEAIKYDKIALTSTLTSLLTKKMPTDMQLMWYREEKEDGTIDDLFSFINRELAARSRQKRINQQSDAKVPGDGSKPENGKKSDHNSKGTVSALHAGAKQQKGKRNQNQKPFPCFFCDTLEHRSGKCHIRIKERAQILKKIQRCRRCSKKTSADHEEKNCTVKCRQCDGPHHIYLCNKLEPASKAPTAKGGSDAGDKGYTSTVSISKPNDLILQTALVLVTGPKGVKKIRVLFDGGAHLSYITEVAAEALGLRPVGMEQQRVNVFGGGVEKLNMKKVVATLKSGEGNIDVVCLQIPKICDPVPAVSLGEWREHIEDQKLVLAEGVVKTGRKWDGQIDLLIGTQDLYAILKDTTIRLGENLVAVESVFGWLLHGVLRGPTTARSSLALISNSQKVEKVEVLLKRIFDFDSWNANDAEGIIEDPFISHFKSTVTQLNNGQYQLRLPLKKNRPDLPTNLHLAQQHVERLIKKWKKADIKVLLDYHNEILGFIENGFVEVVPAEEMREGESKPHYLQHRPVMQPHKNTKMRPVFNASFGRPSLNDCLHTGENHVPLMWDVLQRLRLWKYMVTADIRKAFLHLCLDPRDRDFQRFLWVEDPLAEVLIFRHLRWKVVMFGATSSPAQLQATLELHVARYLEQYPRTAALLARDRFVDDLATGADTRKEAIKIAVEARAILAEAGMDLQRWKSNDQTLQREFDETINKAPSSNTGAQAPVEEEGEREVNNETDFDQINLFDSALKVFGSVLMRSKDIFTFDTTELEAYCETLKHRTCLRSVLSVTARVYDVMGFISPVVIIARIIMQEIWREKMHWDQELPLQLKKEFWTWADGLKDLKKIEIPRHLFRGESRPSNVQLHICCDASVKAYGACAYARGKNEIGEVTTTFIGSMANVAPSSPPTLPRLELLGAVKAIKLMLAVKKAFAPELEFTETFFWTDSMIVLHWIKGEWYLWKPYVANRVRFVQEHSDPSAWRHIVGVDNPADICSRGMTAKQLAEPKNPWWTGPGFWALPRDQWPYPQPVEDARVLEEVNSEAKKGTHALFAMTRPSSRPLFNVNRYSTLSTVLRLTAWIQRGWGDLVRQNIQREESPVTGADNQLSAFEIALAKNYWFRHLQLIAFASEISLLQRGKPVPQSSKLAIFRPYITPQDGLVRLNGRTKLSASLHVTPDVPILPATLPDRKGIPHFILLIIRFAHSQVCHSGVGDTLAFLRRTCWIIRGRQVVKKVLFACVTCNRAQRKPYDQLTGLLPLSRCTFSSPFNTTGLDLAGPFFVREHKKKEKRSSRAKRAIEVTEQQETAMEVPGSDPENEGRSAAESEDFKVWVLLLTCAATRGIHLELVMKMDAPEIVMALDRFVSRRGVPSVIYSDNAKQFQRADKDIAAKWKAVNDALLRHAAMAGIDWRYIAEGAPWWGGFWERLVGSTKRLTKKIVGKARLTVKELETSLCKVEAVINSRPITFQYDDHREPRPLTPNDLLIGSKGAALLSPPVEFIKETTQMELQQRVRYRQMLTDEFERRWTEEYLQERALQFQKKHKTSSIRIGEVVLIAADNVKRHDWILGVITKLYPSADGVVRSVELRTATGSLRRPVQRLCALEVALDDALIPIVQPYSSAMNEVSAEEEAQEIIEGAESASGRQPPSNDYATVEDLSTDVDLDDPTGRQPSVGVESTQVANVVQTRSNLDSITEAGEGDEDVFQPLHVDDHIANAQGGSVENSPVPSRPMREKKRKTDPNFVYY